MGGNDESKFFDKEKILFFGLTVAEIPPKHETATNLSRQQTSLLGSGTGAAGGRLFKGYFTPVWVVPAYVSYVFLFHIVAVHFASQKQL